MAHILNRPKIDEQKNIVIDGYGIMQPRVGINLDISYKTLFTKIFAGAGGIDSYTYIKITSKREFLQEKEYMT